MALPGVPQTFAVEGARDMLAKFWWEIESFGVEACLEVKLWWAFNCAVTAWHLTDWVWKDGRRRGEDLGTLKEFQQQTQDRSRELRICKFIANASKHSGVDYTPDPTIQVLVSARDTPEPVPMTEISNSANWEVVIKHVGGESDALTIFYSAYEYWKAWIYKN